MLTRDSWLVSWRLVFLHLCIWGCLLVGNGSTKELGHRQGFEVHLSSWNAETLEELIGSPGLSRDKRRFKRAVAPSDMSRMTDCKPYQALVTSHPDTMHTFCLAQNPDCEIYSTKVTKEEIKTILKLHNELRSKVAVGKESRGKPGPQPPAILMNELTWDDELAEIAHRWAVQCIDAQGIGEPMPQHPHDCTECRRVLGHEWPFVGQNVAWSASWSSDGSAKLQSQWTKHIFGWYDEVKDFSRTEVEQFKGDQPGQPMIGHYTQVVWGSTSKIGCGAAYYRCNIRNSSDGKVYKGECLKYVCNYGPGGNIGGMKLYEQPCNQTSDDFPGLCRIEL